MATNLFTSDSALNTSNNYADPTIVMYNRAGKLCIVNIGIIAALTIIPDRIILEAVLTWLWTSTSQV